MSIEKLVAGVDVNDEDGSTGSAVAVAVNTLINQRAQNSQKVILFGDSYAATQNNPPDGNTVSFSLYRFILGRLGAGAIVSRNAGVSGNRFDNMVARIDADVFAYESDWVFVNGGVNDIYGNSQSAADTFANAKLVIDAIIAKGRKVAIFNCPPQVSTRTGFSSAKSLECAKYNVLLANYLKTIDGAVLVDIYRPLLNWSDTTNGSAVADYFSNDGIHLSTFGEIVAAEQFISACGKFFQLSVDLENSPLNPGIAGSEGLFAGTSGTNGTASSGSVATSYTSSRVSGAGTIVCSKLPMRGQRQSFTLAATNGEFRSRLQGNLLSELTPFIGKTVSTKILFRIKVSSGSASLKDVLLKLTTTDGTTVWQAVNGGALGGYAPITDTNFDTGLCLIQLRDLFINTGINSSSGMYFETLLDSVSGGVVDFDIYGVEIREVV